MLHLPDNWINDLIVNPQANMTNHDWPLRAAIQGPGFFGPPMVLAKAYNTTKYPLVFKPQNETIIQVISEI